MVQPDAMLPDNKVTLLRLRSRRRIWIAWLLAGPFTPVFWLWVLNLFRFEPGVLPSEPTLLVFAGSWLFTGFPSMVGVSLGFVLYKRLKLKDEGNVYLVAISAALITAALFVFVLSVGIAIFEAKAGRDPVFSIFFTLGVGSLLGSIAAVPMAVASFAVIRTVALTEEIVASSA